MPTTIITAARDTNNLNADQKRIEMGRQIALLEPESTPLTRLLAELESSGAINPVIKWQEQELEPRYDAINNGAGYATGAVSVVVDNAAYFAVDDIVRVTRTGENVRVTAVVTGTNTLTIVRAIGSTAVAMLDNDELLILGSAKPEGDTSPSPRSTNPTTVTNYLQIRRKSWELTETSRSTDNQVEPHDWNLQAKLKGIEHAKDKEGGYLWGTPSEDVTGTHPRRTSGGVLNYIVTNQTDAGGALTNAEFNGAMRTGFRYPGYGKRKVAFASALTVGVLNQYAADKIQMRQGESTFGLAVTDYVSPFGTLRVFTHPLLEGSKFGGYLIGLDLSNIKRRYLNGGVGGSRDTHINTNIQANDSDSRKDEYLTEDGLEVRLEKTHFLITGVTS